MGLRDDILKLWLPTKWSALIMGLTIASAAVAIYLPEFLQRYDIQLSKEKTLLIRVSVPLLILWIGTFFVLLVVLHHFKTIMPQKQPLPALPTPDPKLPKLQEDILIHLFNHKGTLLTFQIAQKLSMEDKEEIVKYHLRELTPKFIKELTLPGIGPPGQYAWFITDKGKEYLIENKLIS